MLENKIDEMEGALKSSKEHVQFFEMNVPVKSDQFLVKDATATGF